MNSNVIYVNKKSNMTSFDVCYKLRKVFNTKSIGHTGTLDPMATGVMIVLVGKATKANQFLSLVDKEYIAKVELGYLTDTLDKDGKIVEKRDFKPLDKSKLLEVFKSFIGTYDQQPPLTSAIKVDGKKLYEYQRQQIPVMIPKRPVTITRLDLLEFSDNSFTFRCEVTSGTYVRALMRDILDKLDMIGTLVALERIRVGNVKISDTDSLDDIENFKYHSHSLYDVLAPNYEIIEYPYPDDIMNGKRIKINAKDDKVLIVNNKEVLAIYIKENDGTYRSLRGLF